MYTNDLELIFFGIYTNELESFKPYTVFILLILLILGQCLPQIILKPSSAALSWIKCDNWFVSNWTLEGTSIFAGEVSPTPTGGDPYAVWQLICLQLGDAGASWHLGSVTTDMSPTRNWVTLVLAGEVMHMTFWEAWSWTVFSGTAND